LLKDLPGKKILVHGNHDNTDTLISALNVGFHWACNQMQIKIAGQDVLISHYPYLNSSLADQHADQHTGKLIRYIRSYPFNEGKWLIHGHVHSRWKQKDKMICVSVENWDYTPVPMKAIESIIMKGENNGI